MSRPEKAQPEVGLLEPASPAPESNTFRAVIEKVNAGDKDALVKLRTVLKTSRKAAALLGGDLSFEANARLITSLARDRRVEQEALFQELQNLRQELCGENQHLTGLERLIIEDVVATWLHLHRLQYLYARHERATYPEGSFHQKEITAAHKRYHAAIRALIDARRRPLAAIQINVADKQVNFAGNVTAAATPNETPAPLG